MSDHEARIQLAIRDLVTGVYKSERAACTAWNVKRSTFRARRRGRLPHAIAHQPQQRLSPAQERRLADWILNAESRGQAPSHTRVREIALIISRENGNPEPIGKQWVTHFITRNPRVASIVGRSIEASRATAATPEIIRAFFELFERTRARLNIQLEDVWNMDETGDALGVCNNSQVLGSSKKSKAYKKTPGTREWATIIEAISATGATLQCVVIFKGKHVWSNWFPSESVPDWLYTSSINGWTSNAIAVEWVDRVFQPGTARPDGRDRMLILDGHGSHTSPEFMWKCYQNKIHLLFLPAHTSHILQPLDLAPFSVVKSKYRDEISELSLIDDAAPVKKERFIRSYKLAPDAGLSPRVIRAGWKATGISPFNPELVLNSSQVLAQVRTPPPASPPEYILGQVLKTPQSSQELYKVQQLLERSERLTRSMRAVLGKAGKAIAVGNANAAELQMENQRLKSQLEQLKPHQPRKQVKKSPNQRFSNIEAIKKAMDAAAAEAAKNKRNFNTKAAAKAAAEAAALSLASMCTEWQI